MKQDYWEEADLIERRLGRDLERIEAATRSLKDEQAAAVRSLKAQQKVLNDAFERRDAWARIASAVAASGDETPAQIADLVEEEADAARCICGILDLPRETRPEALVEHVRRFKDKLDKLREAA